MALGFRDGSVGKMLAQDLSSIPRTYVKIFGCDVCPCNPSIGEEETGGSLGLSSLTDELPARKGSVSKEAEGKPNDDTRGCHSGATCVCMCIYTHICTFIQKHVCARARVHTHTHILMVF